MLPAKCISFSTSVQWCGRLISADGIRYDLGRLDGLLTMETATTGTHLQQFLCALQWVRNGIREFTDLVQTLHEAMERVYARTGKRTKHTVPHIQLSITVWSPVE